MSLTDIKVRQAKPTGKRYKLYDEKGLYLEVSASGGKWWRFKYRFNNKEKLLSLGIYPDISLKEARDRRDSARNLVANGIDPSEHRKAHKTAAIEKHSNNFESIAREWLTKQSARWTSGHSKRIVLRLEKDIFPWLGNMPITDITPPILLKTMRRIESRGAVETAHRALSNCGQIFRYAIATGRAEQDPSGDLKGALPPVKGTHLASVTEPKQVGELLRTLDSYQGTFVVNCALKLAPLVFVRPGELRSAKWEDMDLENAEWRFIVSKTSTPLIVPLVKQAVAILEDLHPLTGSSPYVFPSARSNGRPMSDNAILGAMRRLGIDKDTMCGHGFRAMARTILDEVLKVRPDYIEHQLAHAVRDPNGRAYNRTQYLPERKLMMQQWADYLDELKAG